MKGRARPEGAGCPRVPLEVFDTEKNLITVYSSMSEVGRAIGVAPGSISTTFKRKGVSTI